MQPLCWICAANKQSRKWSPMCSENCATEFWDRAEMRKLLETQTAKAKGNEVVK
ncbi:hypothetical protein BH18THE2_BH18THE2_41370 [soil metagenome]